MRLLKRILIGLVAIVSGCYSARDEEYSKITYVGETSRTSSEDLRVKYRPKQGGKIYEFQDVPRYFFRLKDESVEIELEYRIRNDQWSDRVILEKLYFALLYEGTELPFSYDGTREAQEFESAEGWEIDEREAGNYCSWEGITCGGKGEVTGIQIRHFKLKGTIPGDLGHLKDLEVLDLKDNFIRGTIPGELGSLTNMKKLCLSMNLLEGKVPGTFTGLTKLEYIDLNVNKLTGTIPENLTDGWKNLQILDFSENKLSGMIPQKILTLNPKLLYVILADNLLNGTLPQDTSGLKMLKLLSMGSNRLSGTIPTSWMNLPSLLDFKVAGNRLSGTIPAEVFKLSKLEELVLSDNRFTGSIPRGDDVIPGRNRNRGDVLDGGQWSDLPNLSRISLANNQLAGTLPPELLYGVRSSLEVIDLRNNTFTGTIPSEIGNMENLENINLQDNRFSGSLPTEMNRLDPNIELNLTGNLLVGSVPKLFCGGGAMSLYLHRQVGCDAVLCPPGTFHPDGAATLYAGCRPCPESSLLGRRTCENVEFVNGDFDGDGVLSPREILRLLYMYTTGRNWGAQFQAWADPKHNECDLNGIVCVNGVVVKIDLTDAAICSNGGRKAAPLKECHGLPSELALLSQLEILTFNRRQFLRGTLPTELGRLTRLKYLDVSGCPMMTGTLPTELGRLSNLKFLNLGASRFHGTIPDELFGLTNMEKLYLSMNAISGTISPKIGNLKNTKDIVLSRLLLSGTIPEEIGSISALENLEMYGNRFSGTIPSSLGNCTHLKRMDLFNNRLSGTIPESLTRVQSLQIMHAKLNRLTGTISPKFGDLPFLSWFDVSSNKLHGTIPATFGASRSIKDFRLGGNMIYGPVPKSLCTNTNVNGGLTRIYGCDGVICPLGTYSDPGHATHAEGCKPCPDHQTTMYLGANRCDYFPEKSILSIFFDVMGGQSWNAAQKKHWKDMYTDVCTWEGITCDESKAIESVQFPLVGVGDPETPNRDAEEGDFSMLVPRIG